MKKISTFRRILFFCPKVGLLSKSCRREHQQRLQQLQQEAMQQEMQQRRQQETQETQQIRRQQKMLQRQQQEQQEQQEQGGLSLHRVQHIQELLQRQQKQQQHLGQQVALMEKHHPPIHIKTEKPAASRETNKPEKALKAPEPPPHSGFYGVSAKKSNKKKNKKRWLAQIYYDSKIHNLGCFDNKQEAALVYDRAARQYGKDKPLNYDSIKAAEEAAVQAQATSRAHPSSYPHMPRIYAPSDGTP